VLEVFWFDHFGRAVIAQADLPSLGLVVPSNQLAYSTIQMNRMSETTQPYKVIVRWGPIPEGLLQKALKPCLAVNIIATAAVPVLLNFPATSAAQQFSFDKDSVALFISTAPFTAIW